MEQFFQQIRLDIPTEIVTMYMNQLMENRVLLEFQTDVLVDEDGITAVLIFACQCPDVIGQFLIDKYDIHVILFLVP